MTKLKRKARSEKADVRGGMYFRLPHCLMDHPAFRTASFRAQTALGVLGRRHNGFNNGRITMSSQELAIGLNCQNHRANSAAMRELMTRGLVELMKDHPRGSRLAREYRLTFVSTMRAGQIQPATNEYLQWREGDAGTVQKRKRPKSRVVMTTKEKGLSSVVIAEDAKQTDPIFSPANGSAEREPFVSVEPSIAVITTHIGNHVGTATADLADAGGPDRPKRSEPTRPLGIAEDAWRLAGIRAAENPAAPAIEEVRSRTVRFLDGAPRGTQTQLSRETGIPGGTLSLFINHEGPLSPRHRIDLACALARLGAQPEQGKAAA